MRPIFPSRFFLTATLLQHLGDSSCIKVESISQKIDQVYRPILPWSLLYRIAIKVSRSLSTVYMFSIFSVGPVHRFRC